MNLLKQRSSPPPSGHHHQTSQHQPLSMGVGQPHQTSNLGGATSQSPITVASSANSNTTTSSNSSLASGAPISPVTGPLQKVGGHPPSSTPINIGANFIHTAASNTPAHHPHLHPHHPHPHHLPHPHQQSLAAAAVAAAAAVVAARNSSTSSNTSINNDNQSPPPPSLMAEETNPTPPVQSTATTAVQQLSSSAPTAAVAAAVAATAAATATNVTSLATASTPLLMGGEHSAFRSLVNPSSAAAFALGLARQYAAAASISGSTQSSLSSANGTSNGGCPPQPTSGPGGDHIQDGCANTRECSESEEEINVNDDDSDVEIQNSRTPLQLTKHDRQ